jgi:AraC-like DNA-binding protein
MASSQVMSFTDPVEYAAAIQGVDVDVDPSATGPFAASLTRITFKSLVLLRLSENQPRIMRVAPRYGRIPVISFQTKPGPSVFERGAERTSDSITRHAMHEPYFQRSVVPVGLASLSFPAGDMQSVGLAAAECEELMPPRSHTVLTPRPGAMARLRELHRAAALLATEMPDVLANPEVARGLEQALIQAMVSCLRAPDIHKNTSKQHRHAAIMRRFHQVLEADAHRSLYMHEVAQAVGVSARTLSACCAEHLGMGPKQYLMLRRMNLVRRALSVADPGVTNVTAVATEYGFWELGRFALNYKRRFGESPSTTLRRQRA